MYGKAISVFERTITEVESSRGRGPLSADECVDRLREYISEVKDMREEDEEYASEEECPSEEDYAPEEELYEEEDISEEEYSPEEGDPLDED